MQEKRGVNIFYPPHLDYLQLEAIFAANYGFYL